MFCVYDMMCVIWISTQVVVFDELMDQDHEPTKEEAGQRAGSPNTPGALID
jgi:hypothetical protein